MRARRHAALVLAAVVVVSGCAKPGTAPAAQAAAPISPTASRTPFMIDGTPATDPRLDDVAQALGEQGRGAFGDVYSSLIVDTPPGQVSLYVTDDARGRQLVTAAKKVHPDIDDRLVRIVSARFSRRAIDAQMNRIMPTSGGDPALYGASANPDGSGITVTAAADRVATEQARLTALITASTGIPVTVKAGHPVRMGGRALQPSTGAIGRSVGEAHPRQK